MRSRSRAASGSPTARCRSAISSASIGSPSAPRAAAARRSVCLGLLGLAQLRLEPRLERHARTGTRPPPRPDRARARRARAPRPPCPAIAGQHLAPARARGVAHSDRPCTRAAAARDRLLVVPSSRAQAASSNSASGELGVSASAAPPARVAGLDVTSPPARAMPSSQAVRCRPGSRSRPRVRVSSLGIQQPIDLRPTIGARGQPDHALPARPAYTTRRRPSSAPRPRGCRSRAPPRRRPPPSSGNAAPPAR